MQQTVLLEESLVEAKEHKEDASDDERRNNLGTRPRSGVSTGNQTLRTSRGQNTIISASGKGRRTTKRGTRANASRRVPAASKLFYYMVSSLLDMSKFRPEGILHDTDDQAAIFRVRG